METENSISIAVEGGSGVVDASAEVEVGINLRVDGIGEVEMPFEDAIAPEQRLRRLNDELSCVQRAMLASPGKKLKRELRQRCKELDAQIGGEHENYRDVWHSVNGSTSERTGTLLTAVTDEIDSDTESSADEMDSATESPSCPRIPQGADSVVKPQPCKSSVDYQLDLSKPGLGLGLKNPSQSPGLDTRDHQLSAINVEEPKGPSVECQVEVKALSVEAECEVEVEATSAECEVEVKAATAKCEVEVKAAAAPSQRCEVEAEVKAPKGASASAVIQSMAALRAEKEAAEGVIAKLQAEKEAAASATEQSMAELHAKNIAAEDAIAQLQAEREPRGCCFGGKAKKTKSSVDYQLDLSKPGLGLGLKNPSQSPGLDTRDHQLSAINVEEPKGPSVECQVEVKALSVEAECEVEVKATSAECEVEVKAATAECEVEVKATSAECEVEVKAATAHVEAEVELGVETNALEAPPAPLTPRSLFGTQADEGAQIEMKAPSVECEVEVEVELKAPSVECGMEAEIIEVEESKMPSVRDVEVDPEMAGECGSRGWFSSCSTTCT